MKKKRKLKKSVKIAIALIAVLLIATYGKGPSGENSSNENNFVVIENPTKYVEEFQKRAESDSRYNDVINNIEDYPEDVIKLLYSNGETLDFVLSKDNFKKPAFLVNIDEDCGDGKIPLLQQWDPKWGWREYGNNVIAINGCGPTALSMVVSGLTGDKDITPIKIAKYSDKHGFHEAAGTNWNLMVEGARKYEVKARGIENTKSSFENALKNGNPIICSVGPGDFTREGHFIVIAGLKDGKLIIHDPNNIARSEKLWNYNDIKSQIKAAWAYSLD